MLLAGAGGVLAAMTAGTPAAASAQASTGQSLPDFDLPDAKGRRWRREHLGGRPAALVWTMTSCPYFRKHFESGNLPALMRETMPRGMQWFIVESNRAEMRDYFDPSEGAEILRRLGAGDVPLLMDDRSELARAVGAQRATHCAVADAAGRLVYLGGIDSIDSVYPEDIARAVPHLRHAVEDVLAGRPPRLAASRAYGCALMLART